MLQSSAAARAALIGVLAAAAFGLGAAAAGVLPVRVHESRFVDSSGRERHFRGVNVVYKDAPFLPNVQHFHANLSFVQDDVDLLASLGINLIRLGVMWPGVVPARRGAVDAGYLQRTREIVRMAAAAGIYTIVEPHQDELSPRLCGEGVPDWWADEFLKVTDFPVPLAAAFGTSTPSQKQCLSQSSFDYLWTHDMAKSFQTLWKHGARDFGDFFAEVAAAFAEEPGVVGGELFNEPFPGDVYADEGRLRRNKLADAENLAPFYSNVTRSIRAAVPEKAKFTIAYEPTWPVGDQDLHPKHLLTPISGFSSLPEGDAIYAFHYYSPPATDDFKSYFAARAKDARRLQAAPFCSELNLYVGDAASEADMAEQLAALESDLISFTGWQYKSYSGSLPDGTCTGCGNSFFNDDGVLNVGMARAMARPFAGAVAGRTIAAGYNQSAQAFRLEYTCCGLPPAAADSPTEIVFPGLTRPAGSDLRVTVEGDDSHVVEHSMVPGRQIAGGPMVQPRRVVRVYHGAAAAGRRVAVVVKVVLHGSPEVVGAVYT